jgi:pyruvate dehydrogenase E2 component (dihydrolipoamide acetyltransferase)
MPALEMAQETGKLVSWLKKEGEPVRKGEMLLEVETDKAVVEVEAGSDGILAGITAQVGDVVPVGQTIAWLVQPGEKPPEAAKAVQTGRTGAAAVIGGGSTTSHTPDPTRAAADPGLPGAAAGFGRPEPSGPVRISPKARKLAREHGVDINAIKGSGPGGEILADDILNAGRLKPAPTTETSVVSGFSRTEPVSGGSQSEPLSSIGRIMAERTTQSWTTVPHFFVARDVDATALNAAREKLITPVEQSHGVKVTHTDLLVSAVAKALRKHPRMNGSWSGGGIRLNDDVNVALAMAVENAVVTAVIRNADRAAVGEIAVQRRELAERARANRLQPADITGATFTISNLGMFGVDAFTAIIVPPQAGILAVGAIADRVVAVNGEPRVRPMMTLTLSSDHRIVDGARAAEFLNDVVSALQQL